MVSGRVFLGGHSYGGRQASMLAAEEPTLAQALLLLSYPLHPPRNPAKPRTAHFPALRTPAFFVHGSADPFGALAEMAEALRLVPGPTRLMTVEGAGHELARGGPSAPGVSALAERIVSEFLGWARSGAGAGG